MKKGFKYGDHAEKKNVMPFSQEFNYLSPADLEDILEWLEERTYLSDKGRTFRNRFWSLFIKKI